MSPIPWSAILMHGPRVLDAAHMFFTAQTRKANERHLSHEARLDQLEKASVESAKLIQDLAEQIQALTLAHQESANKLRTAFVVSCTATAVAIVAVILALVR